MTDKPPLTVSVWVAEIIRRWKLFAATAAVALTAGAIAAATLPPIYRSYASFITPGETGSGISLAGITDQSDAALRAALGSPDPSLESPRYYVKLLESEQLRRRLLVSTFPDPRSGSPRDSAMLVDIMQVRSDDPRRRMEMASRKLSKSLAIGVDMNMNLVAISIAERWPDLSAAVANRMVSLADEMAQEQRSERTRERKSFSEQRVADAKVALAVAEERLESFEDQNRLWRSSPELVSTASTLRRNAQVAEVRYLSQQQNLERARLEEASQQAEITVVDPAVTPRKAAWPRYGRLLASGVAAATLLGFLVAGLAAFVSARGDSAASAITPQVYSNGSWLSRVGFPVFAWGLVFHSLVITALFGWFGLSVDTVRSMAAWKEIALIVLLAAVILRAVAGRGPGATLAWPDMWVGGLLATALLFLLIENHWLRYNLPPGAEMFGFRDAVYFMLLYFVGRSMPELVSREGAMRALFILVAVTAVIGVIERTVVSPEMLVALGVASYFQDFLGVGAFTIGNVYGLPLNYWTMIGGELFRRAGSVYLSGQGFAVPFLLFFPLATAWVFLRPSRSRALVLSYIVISAALLLTLTRMTILIALIQLVLFVCLLRRPEWAVAGLVISFLMFLAAFVFISGFPAFVWQTLSWQEGSSVSHVNDWLNGLSVFFQNPWGSGLGTADQTAVRSGLPHLTGDNLYLKYGVEMGAIGLALLVLILASVGRSALRLFRLGATQAERRMGITLWLAAIGIAINGITAVVFSSITLGWLFFWLAGAAVTVAQPLSGKTLHPGSAA